MVSSLKSDAEVEVEKIVSFLIQNLPPTKFSLSGAAPP